MEHFTSTRHWVTESILSLALPLPMYYQTDCRRCWEICSRLLFKDIRVWLYLFDSPMFCFAFHGAGEIYFPLIPSYLLFISKLTSHIHLQVWPYSMFNCTWIPFWCSLGNELQQDRRYGNDTASVIEDLVESCAKSMANILVSN